MRKCTISPKTQLLVKEEDIQYETEKAEQIVVPRFFLEPLLTQIHHDQSCPSVICKKQFTQKGNLETHKLSVHGGMKYKCDICLKKFRDRKYLSTNKLIVHEGKHHIKYECQICDFTKVRIYTKKVSMAASNVNVICEI